MLRYFTMLFLWVFSSTIFAHDNVKLIPNQSLLGIDYLKKVTISSDSFPLFHLDQKVGRTRFMHPQNLVKTVYTNDDKIIIAAGMEYITAWDSKKGNLKWHYRFPTFDYQSRISRVICPFKTKPWVLVGNDNGNSIILHSETGDSILQFDNLEQWVSAASLSHDENLIFVSGLKGNYFLWDFQKNKTISIELPAFTAIYSARFSNTGKYLIIAGKDTNEHAFLIYNFETKSYELFSREGCQAGYSAAFSQDDQLIVLGYFGGGLEFRTTVGGELMWSLKGITPNWVSRIEFIKNDKEMIALTARKLLRIDVASGDFKRLHSVDGNNEVIEDFALDDKVSKIIIVERGKHRINQYYLPSLQPIKR